MKVLAVAAILSGCVAAQTPDVREIMTRVGENQEKAQDLRKEFTFRQKQLLRMNRGNGKLAREEKREYDVSPKRHSVSKELAHFEGRYEYKGKYVPYDRPGYKYKDMDIDGVAAEILFPPQRTIGHFLGDEDDDFVLAGVDAYNNFLVEQFCAPDPRRLVGMAQIPSIGIDASVDTLRKAKARGFRESIAKAP